MKLQDKLNAKRALLRVIDAELGELTGRFLTKEEQLRVISINDEQDRLEGEISQLEITLRTIGRR